MKKSTILMILLVIFIMGLVGCGKKEESSVIRVAVCPTSPPNLFEENGKYKGLDLELFEGFCKARNRQYKITSYDWQGMLAPSSESRPTWRFQPSPLPTSAKK